MHQGWSYEHKPLSTNTWQQQLADLVLSLASERFYGHLAHACRTLSGCNSVLVVWLGHDHRPISLYSEHTGEEALQSSSLWLDGGYLVDPYYTLFKTKASEGFYLLDDVAPDNFSIPIFITATSQPWVTRLMAVFCSI